MTRFLFIFSSFVIFIYSVYTNESKVTIKLGTIYGFKENINGKEVNVFLGIPFALPPIGDLRFRKPQPIIEKWNSPINATKWPKMCMQDSLLLKPYNEISEDCLYLNVWSPVNFEDFDKKLKDVIVNIPTGAFTYMGSSYINFNASFISAFGDVVFVTMNYRIGAFGFLSTGNSQAPGNAGLYDQALVLEWVQENIAYFGGDPKKVTLFGESAGAMSISLHLISPLTQNTFKRAIISSGAVFRGIDVESKNVALKKGLKLAKLLGCDVKEGEKYFSDDHIACLRNVKAMKIVEHQTNPQISVLSECLSKLWFVPIFDEAFIPKKPEDMLLNGEYEKTIDILVGTMANEGFIMDFLFNVLGISLESGDWYQRLSSLLPKFFNKLSRTEIDKILEFYFSDKQNTANDKAKMAYYTALGDIFFNCETVFFSEVFSKFNNLYQYSFDYSLKNNNDNLFPCDLNKACHGNELPLIFGTVSDQKDKEVSRKWMKIVLDFTKNGTVDWPKHEAEFKPYYEFIGSNQSGHLMHNFRSDACELWREIMKKQ